MNMKPMIILPPDTMSKEDIQTLRDNDMCVVEATDPTKVKFVDPIPVSSSRTQIESAAIQLSRRILQYDSTTWNENCRMDAQKVWKTFIDLVIAGSPLDPKPSKAEMEQQIFDSARADELRKIAREEARAERQSKKEAEAKAKTSNPKGPKV